MSPSPPTKVMNQFDALKESLLQESSQAFQESTGLVWEWEHFTKLHKMVGEIEAKEAGRDALDSLEGPNNSKARLKGVQPFMDWLEEQEVNTSKLKIKDMGSSGLGLVTTVPIKAGEEVLVIPHKIMMTTINAKESKLKILAEKDPVLRSMPNVLMSLFLLYEKFVSKETSFWRTYIDLLPSSYDTIPYFTIQEMELLRNYPTAFREAVKMYRNIVRQYAYFHGVFRRSTDSASRALKNVFTYRRYAWAASTAMTRQNSLSMPGQGLDELCLIPLWDMCNHEATGQFSNAYDPEEKHLACYASHDYHVNTEFFIYYGERTSIDHFVHGGFVPDTYSADIFKLEMGIGIHDRDLSRKEPILAQFGMKCQEAFAVHPAQLAEAARFPLKNLFAFVRIFQADKALLDQIEVKDCDLTFLTTPTAEVWKFLATRFALLKVSAENSKLNLLKVILKGNTSQLNNRHKMIVQLLQNEVKLLEMLAHCAKDQMK